MGESTVGGARGTAPSERLDRATSGVATKLKAAFGAQGRLAAPHGRLSGGGAQ